MKRYIHRLRTDRRSRQAATALAASAIAFAGLAHTFRLDWMRQIDLRTTQALQSTRSGLLDAFMIGLTSLGTAVALVMVAVVGAVELVRKRDRAGALMLLLSLLALPLNVRVKDLFGRPRPAAPLVEIVSPTSGLSFPSGHAMGCASLLGVLAAMCWVHASTPERGRRWVALIVAFHLAICATRIYLGVHWLSDVAAGTAMGLFIAGILIEIYRAKRPDPITSGSD